MRPSPKSLSGSLAMARAGRCPSPQTPGAGSPTTSLRTIGSCQTHEARSHARRSFVGLGFASLGHAQEPGINGPTSREVHVDHVAAVGALGGLFHARSIDPARFTVTRNQNQNKSSTEGGSRLG